MDETISVRCLDAGEAPRLVACVRRCYGDTYADRSFYDSEGIARRIDGGSLRSIVAVNAAGEVVGHMGISLRRTGDITADAGTTLVDPRYRGRKIARSVAIELARQAVDLGLVAVHDYPVTVHGATQKLGAEIGAESGLMLSNMPAETSFREMEDSAGGARTASLIRYLPMRDAPEREVFPPARYTAIVRDVYERAGLSRHEADPASGLAMAPASLEAAVDERRGVQRMNVVQSGSDLVRQVEAALATGRAANVHAVQIDLPLADPATPAGVEQLRPLGFFFCGVLPEYRDGDVVRLQRVVDDVLATAIPVLENDAGRALRDLVIEDARTVRSPVDPRR